MHFDWDTKKATVDRCKHSVAFVEATVLRDVFSATAHDPDIWPISNDM